jgi:hypothetical protein
MLVFTNVHLCNKMVIFVIYLLAKQICHLGDFEPGANDGQNFLAGIVLHLLDRSRNNTKVKAYVILF